MLDKTKNYKINVSALSTVERTALQEELFKQGYKWYAGEQEVEELDMDFLFLYDDMDITCCGERRDFIESNHTPITVSDIMPQPEERTLRDWFAGLAMQGMVVSAEILPENVIARDAYAYADAMLKERNK